MPLCHMRDCKWRLLPCQVSPCAVARAAGPPEHRRIAAHRNSACQALHQPRERHRPVARDQEAWSCYSAEAPASAPAERQGGGPRSSDFLRSSAEKRKTRCRQYGRLGLCSNSLNQLVHSEELLLQLRAQVKYEEFVLLTLLNSLAAIPSEGARSVSCR